MSKPIKFFLIAVVVVATLAWFEATRTPGQCFRGSACNPHVFIVVTATPEQDK